MGTLDLDDLSMSEMFAGPFKLQVPRLGGQEVTIFGLRSSDLFSDPFGNVKDSQQRFVERYKRPRRYD